MLKEKFINSSFIFYLFSVGFNVLGSSMFEISAVIYVYRESEQNPLSIALYMLSMALPTIILPPLGGAIGSRFSRKSILIISQITIAFLSLLMFVSPQSSYIYFLALIMSAVSVLSGPSRGSYIPDLLEKDKLLKANSLVQASSSLSNIVGVLLAGALILFLDPVYGFILHSICFGFSAILIYFTKPKVKYTVSPLFKHREKVTKIVKEMTKSISELIRLKAAFRITLILGIVLGISGIINVLYLVFLTESLKENESLYSLLMLIESAGLFLGSISIKYFKKYLGTNNLLFISVILDGLCIAAHMFINNVIIFFLIGLFTGIVGSFIFIITNTLLQKAIDDEKRAQLMGAHQTLLGLFSIPGLLIGGIIQKFGDIKIIFLLSGMSIMLVGVIYLIIVTRKNTFDYEGEGIKTEK